MRRILAAVLSMGLSSVVMMLLSAVRAKIVALELGATGIGMLGIVTTSVVLASTALGAGLGASGVRAVAAAGDTDGRRSVVQVAVARGSFVLALVAAPLVGLGWWWWGDLVVPDADAPSFAPWVALSVVAAIGSAGAAALLNGLGRIGALASATALGSVVGTVVFVVAMQLSDHWGLVAAFAAVPVSTLLIGGTLARSTYPRGVRPPRRLWVPELGRMLVLGLTISSSVILTNATQLTARVWVSHELDLVQAGYLQAALSVGAVYLGFVLNALAAEYYPRISALHRDSEQLNRAANDQVRIVLTLGGPVILWMIAAAPWLLHLLYSSEFQVAQELLRLLLVGDVFKLVGWCIGFLFLAREARLKFFLAEICWNVLFLAMLIPLAHRSLEAAGYAYVTAYFLYTVFSLVLARRETGFVLVAGSRRVVMWFGLGSIGAFVAVELGSDLGLAAALLTAFVFSVVAAWRLFQWTRGDQPGSPATVPAIHAGADKQ